MEANKGKDAVKKGLWKRRPKMVEEEDRETTFSLQNSSK